MADAQNKTHLGNLPVLQPLPPRQFISKKACSSQKQQQQPDLQKFLNNNFHLFAYTIMSKFEDLTSKTVEKVPSRDNAKGKRLSKGRKSDNGRTSCEL